MESSGPHLSHSREGRKEVHTASIAFSRHSNDCSSLMQGNYIYKLNKWELIWDIDFFLLQGLCLRAIELLSQYSYSSVEAGVTRVTLLFCVAVVVNFPIGTVCTKIKTYLLWCPNCMKQPWEAELNTTLNLWNCQGVWKNEIAFCSAPSLAQTEFLPCRATFKLKVLLGNPACSLFNGQISFCWDPQHFKGVRLWQD